MNEIISAEQQPYIQQEGNIDNRVVPDDETSSYEK
jgi:hypothetical protein